MQVLQVNFTLLVAAAAAGKAAVTQQQLLHVLKFLGTKIRDYST